ncbi:uncharacterized protein LOC141842354 [Curcuma longa]|uniref:uncharacterized protein LOC141842354 n=1 Tax=Curcuma longa TaxID=136217 RepID=UPI003D9DE4D4
MAEVSSQKPLSLAEQYSLQDIEKIDQAEVPVEVTPEKESLANASSEVVVSAVNFASEVVPENTSETSEPEVIELKANQTPTAEEVSVVEETNNVIAEEPETEGQEAEEPELKIETAPADFRFPTTNQTRHCFTRYIEYHRCIAAKGEDASECDKFAKYYRSLCPSEWVERWNEQRANGTFPGPL